LKCQREDCEREANKWVQTERKDMLICGQHSKGVKGTKKNVKDDIKDIIQIIRENSDSFNSGVLIAGLENKYLNDDFPATVTHNLTI